MRIRYRYCLRFFVCLTLSVVFSALLGQENRVLVQQDLLSTNEKPIILLKWYSKNLVNRGGVNIYRKAINSLSWEKITASPVRMRQSVDPALLASDVDMEMFVEIAQKASPQQLQDEMLFLNLVVKSIQSNALANFMGIYYEDHTATAGVTYEYRINRIQNGSEALVGVSNPILAGPFVPARPIERLEAFQNDKTLNLNWEHDEERFYAVNIYRKANSDSAFIKLNQNPLMLSQNPDSLGNLVYPNPMYSENLRLKEGESYTYRLSGVGFFADEICFSEEVSVSFRDVTPPPAPEKLEGKADSMKVHLRWINIPAQDLKGVYILRSVKSDGPYERILEKPLPFIAGWFTDSLTVPGPYYYMVSAADTAGNEARSNVVFVEVQDVIPPAVPQDLDIKTDTGKVSLTWRHNTEPDLAGYYIYRTVDKNDRQFYILLNSDPVKENHFDQVLPRNVKNKFFYYIVAVDTSFNRSKPSKFVSGAMPDILAPEKPFIRNISYADGNVVVEWIKNVDRDLAGYHIYRSDTSKAFSRVNVNILNAETFRYTDRGTEPNTDYFYYLEAVDSVGNISLPSEKVYARRVVKESGQEGSISLRIKYNKRKKQNALQWEYDTSIPLLGYVVFRGEDESRMTPITGLIKSKNFTDKRSEKSERKDKYYQIRAYVGSNVIYSAIVKEKF